MSDTTTGTELIDLSNLDTTQLAKVKEIQGSIHVEDAQAVLTYGVGAQRDIAGFSDSILGEVRAKDAGYVGTIMTDLMLKVKEIDVDSLGRSNPLAGIPLLGSLVDAVKRFVARYEKVSVQIEKILDELEKARLQLLRDVTLLDTLYQKNLEYLKNLDLFIVAGQEKLKELETTVLPGLKAQAEASRDPADAQKFNDFTQFLNRFEKKLHDLKLSRMIAIQTGPQVRLIQNADQVLVEKVQSSILNTIPLWKNQMVIAITLFRQKKALELQKEVSRTTDDLLKKNAELLKDSTLEIARESERGIVEVETLKKVNDDLIATIEETLKIQADGKVRRVQAEAELVKIEADLKAKLLAVKA